MARRFKYKYICNECHKFTWFSPQDRTSAFRVRCSYCGSFYLVPSKNSYAKHNEPIFHQVFMDDKEKRREEMGF
jgi:DNA-directed RNA polymerase subunit RPC12/RpoP